MLGGDADAQENGDELQRQNDELQRQNDEPQRDVDIPDDNFKFYNYIKFETPIYFFFLDH